MRKAYGKVLVADDREPLEFIEILAENCSIPLNIKRLRTGDYVCEDVFIERKTVSDFAHSILDKRLFKQYRRLIDKPHSYILVSGNFEDVESKIHRRALIGAVGYLLTHGVGFAKVDSDEDLAYLILKIFEQHKKLTVAKEFHFE